MSVDPASVWPLSAQLAQLLRELIRTGQLGPGERVPSEPQLARKYSVSRDTAQRALTMLADEGLITRRRGVGSIVADVQPVTEVRARPGTRISARLPTAAEREAARAGMWVPLLAVAEPGWPEQLYPADRVVVVVGPDETHPGSTRPELSEPASRSGTSPAELVEPLVTDSEVMSDLVDHGATDLLDDVVLGTADRADRPPVYGDPVR
jgi:DNA-binding transcriptional regulator YhcF (GntR family)